MIFLVNIERNDKMNIPGASITLPSRPRKEKKRKTNSTANVTPLPATTSTAIPSLFATSSSNTGKYADNVPDEVTSKVRAYIDEIFGALFRHLEHKTYHDFDGNLAFDELQMANHVFPFIGGIVDSILRYNNVHFKEIQVHENQYGYNQPEPLWFCILPEQKCTLHIFVGLNWYTDYVVLRSDVPVIWTDGNVALEQYNPFEEEVSVVMDIAKIKCVTACDHLAQHILHKYNSNSKPLSLSDIHQSWTSPKVGATLHSFINITNLCVNNNNTDNGRRRGETAPIV